MDSLEQARTKAEERAKSASIKLEAVKSAAGDIEKRSAEVVALKDAVESLKRARSEAVESAQEMEIKLQSALESVEESRLTISDLSASLEKTERQLQSTREEMSLAAEKRAEKMKMQLERGVALEGKVREAEEHAKNVDALNSALKDELRRVEDEKRVVDAKLATSEQSAADQSLEIKRLVEDLNNAKRANESALLKTVEEHRRTAADATELVGNLRRMNATLVQEAYTLRQSKQARAMIERQSVSVELMQTAKAFEAAKRGGIEIEPKGSSKGIEEDAESEQVLTDALKDAALSATLQEKVKAHDTIVRDWKAKYEALKVESSKHRDACSAAVKACRAQLERVEAHAKKHCAKEMQQRAASCAR